MPHCTFSIDSVNDAPVHGGNIDYACRVYGSVCADWLDLSTGINPVPYRVRDLRGMRAMLHRLPSAAMMQRLLVQARAAWRVPFDTSAVIAPGVSALIGHLPSVLGTHAPKGIAIATATYGEYACVFAHAGLRVHAPTDLADGVCRIIVHPNNPDGALCRAVDLQVYHQNTVPLVIDESFADLCPEQSLIDWAQRPNTLVLKSIGKFWGLAGLRLGFAFGDRGLIQDLQTRLGPWPVSDMVLAIATQALADTEWAAQARFAAHKRAQRLDRLIGAPLVGAGGTALYRLYSIANAVDMHKRLAHKHRIWTRIFAGQQNWIRLSPPGTRAGWNRLARAWCMEH